MLSKPSGVNNLLSDIQDSLDYLSEIGCQGFDCSDDCMDRIMTWGLTAKKPAESLSDIKADLGACQRCRLSKDRTHIVFGCGNPDARLMFVGEGPGFDEDQQGEPFVGSAGLLLTKIIQAINLTRDAVYIGNIIKCRPPGNRNPADDEIESCLPFIERQILTVNPEYIVALGAIAAQTLLNTNLSISRLRGRFHEFQGIKILPTYHPAYLLRNPDRKREVWNDMKKLMHEMGIG